VILEILNSGLNYEYKKLILIFFVVVVCCRSVVIMLWRMEEYFSYYAPWRYVHWK